MAASGQTTGSMLLVEEYFAREDGRFLAELRRVNGPAALAGFVEKWKRDARPWARAQQLAYIALPLDCPGHEPVVKRLFKQADHAGDDEWMAAFLVAFDRLVRRRRRKRTRYDWQSRSQWEEISIELPRNTIPRDGGRKARNPRTGEKIYLPIRVPKNGRLFSHRTRYYLRRRAARYFRKLGRAHPERYVAAVCRALKLYQDADLKQGEDVLECWGLLQLAFRRSPVLQFGAARVSVRKGESLAQLEPAPRYEALWQAASAGQELLALVGEASSRLVRQWAVQLLRREHLARLTNLDIEDIFRLLNSPHEDIQQLGAELLLGSTNAAKLTIDEWLRLLDVENPTILASICEAMQRHVTADRLSLAQCVALSSAQPTPVARLGLRFLQTRTVRTAEERRIVAALAEARCDSVAAATTAWALQWFTPPDAYDRELVMPFFDSLNGAVRSGAWRWMLDHSPAYDDPLIWVRLTETPFDDVRAKVVDTLQHRSTLPGTSAADLAPIWTSVLLNVHRGGRNKTKAAAQMAQAIAARPERGETLLPVLAVAVRSVRPAEMRTGLAAILRVLAARPELAATVRQHLPELDFGSLEAASWT